jgi:hypothetical protein
VAGGADLAAARLSPSGLAAKARRRRAGSGDEPGLP